MKNVNMFREQVNRYLTEQVNTARREQRESLKSLASDCSVSVNTLKNLGTAKISTLHRVCTHFNIDTFKLLNEAAYHATQFTLQDDRQNPYQLIF